MLTLYQKEPGILEAHLCNDTAEELRGNLIVRRLDFHGHCDREWDIPGSCDPDAATELWRQALEEEDTETGRFFYHARFTAVEEGSDPLESVFFPGPPKSRDIQTCHLSATLCAEGKEIRITLKTDFPAFYVFLEHQERSLLWSDNLFHLLPGEPRTITVTLTEEVTATEWARKMTIHALRNYFPGLEIHITGE